MSNWTKNEGLPPFNPALHSDGCSGGMSWVWGKLPKWITRGKVLPFHHCCVMHDELYYYGGTRREKAWADARLEMCVDETHRSLGTLMRIAVKYGGSPRFNTKFRWGYGSDFRSDHKA